MSVSVMAWVWANGPSSGGDRLVLLAIADHADDDGRAYPSVKGISEKACMTERGARGVIRRLEADGWLETDVGGGRGGKSVYRVLMRETRNDVLLKEPETRNEKPGMKCRPERETRNTDAETRNEIAETRNQGSAEPSVTIINHQDIPPVSPKPKTTRIPEDWTPGEDGISYARDLGLHETEIMEIADDFHAYWSDRTDKGGKKSGRGWRQTWRNRCRDQAPKFIRNRQVAFRAIPGGGGQGGGIAGEVARRRLGG